MKRWIPLNVFAVAVLACGCAGTPREGADVPVPIEGTIWRLVSVEGSSAAPPMGDRAGEFRLDAGAGRFSAMVGVNRMAGSYRRVGDGRRGTIRFPDRIVSTMMAGPPELMEQDRAFIAALTSVDSYALVGGELTLSGGNARRLVFRSPDERRVTHPRVRS